MKYNPLGRSGINVSEICLGTMIFGEQSSRSTPAQEAETIIHRFLDAGGNHIDTANVYADGSSEEIVGKAIRGRRDQVVLATKVRFAMGEGANDVGLSRYHIQNSVEESLRRLQTETIDLLYMHCWDPITPIEESLHTFDDLVRQGKVRYIGVSNFKAWQLMKALGLSDQNGWARFIAAQYQYSLVERSLEQEFTDLCLTEGVGMIPWGPLGGGFLTGKYKRGKKPENSSEGRIATMAEDTEESWQNRNIDRNWKILETINEIVRNKESATYSQVALAWLLKQPAVDSVIVGVRTMGQMEDNLLATQVDISDEEIELLNKASEPELQYPYRFLLNYGNR